MLEVTEAGPLATVQDAGRAGLASIGVPGSGAVDPALAGHCNRLVGNRPDAPLVETVGGLVLRAITAVVVATDVEPVARVVPAGRSIRVPPGVRQWHYLAVRGGIVAEPVLGSCSTDTLSGLGPPPLRPGVVLAVGAEPARAPVGETWPVPPPTDRARVSPGPRLDRFDADVWRTLTSSSWTISDASRVGVRLDGPELVRDVADELPSEGLVRGAIQVPPDGRPIMMLADHPTTGGYPVVAVVAWADVATVAQRLVGHGVRFTASAGPDTP